MYRICGGGRERIIGAGRDVTSGRVGSVVLGMANEEERDAVFQEHRAVLVGVAYRILGSVADAEDVVQEAWLRWSGSTPRRSRTPGPF